jgi:hypothetical protein
MTNSLHGSAHRFTERADRTSQGDAQPSHVGWQVLCGVAPAVGADTGKESTVSMKPTLNLHDPGSAVERIDFAREVGYILQQLFTCSLLYN